MSDKGSGDKWGKVGPAGRGRSKVSDGSEGAAGKAKPEGQRLRRSEIQRAQETLKEMSPAQMVGMLGINKSDLTAKQRAYAYNLAMGNTGADSYRLAYNCKGKPKTVGDNASRLKRDSRIQAEIEAYRLAAEAAKHRTPADLRALVIQALVSQVIDPDIPPAVRTQATKILGQVTEVAAFTERKESIVHHSSDKLRADIFAQVTALMQGKTIEGERIDSDAASLLDELTAARQDPDGPSTAAQDTTPDAPDASDGNAPHAK